MPEQAGHQTGVEGHPPSIDLQPKNGHVEVVVPNKLLNSRYMEWRAENTAPPSECHLRHPPPQTIVRVFGERHDEGITHHPFEGSLNQLLVFSSSTPGRTTGLGIRTETGQVTLRNRWSTSIKQKGPAWPSNASTLIRLCLEQLRPHMVKVLLHNQWLQISK